METPVLIASECGPCGQLRSHAVVRMAADPQRASASRGHRLRCLACRWTRTPPVFHALVDGMGALCGLPLGSVEAAVAATGAITCRACRALTERVYAALPDVETFCAGCQARGPARRHAAIQRDGADRTVTTCRRCQRRHEGEGLRHWLGAGSGLETRCGQGRADALRHMDPSRVDCPLCLQSALPGLVAEAYAAVEKRCEVCAAVRGHQVFRVAVRRREWTLLACGGCGAAQSGGRLRHWHRDEFPCNAPPRAPRTTHVPDVSCGDCLAALVAHAVLPVPDWRPVAAIAEDHYAV
jgi:hypothetical protein